MYLNILRYLKKYISIKTVSGGVGNESRLNDCLLIKGVSAVATVNLFNFVDVGLENARKHLLKCKLNIVDWYIYQIFSMLGGMLDKYLYE